MVGRRASFLSSHGQAVKAEENQYEFPSHVAAPHWAQVKGCLPLFLYARFVGDGVVIAIVRTRNEDLIRYRFAFKVLDECLGGTGRHFARDSAGKCDTHKGRYLQITPLVPVHMVAWCDTPHEEALVCGFVVRNSHLFHIPD